MDDNASHALKVTTVLIPAKAIFYSESEFAQTGVLGSHGSSALLSVRRGEGLELKSESVFLLCALQCQSTHSWSLLTDDAGWT
ncbi:hypothetical protein PAMP_017875 [Pampus punctatissimus]